MLLKMSERLLSMAADMLLGAVSDPETETCKGGC